jgi:hypothetical protein
VVVCVSPTASDESVWVSKEGKRYGQWMTFDMAQPVNLQTLILKGPGAWGGGTAGTGPQRGPATCVYGEVLDRNG